MKTLQDLYEEVMASDEEKRAFVKAMKAGDVEDFLKQHECDATQEELTEFLGQKAEAADAPMALSMDKLRKAAGGFQSIPLPPIIFDTDGCTDSCGSTLC